jgi:hypothetical protein
MPVNDKEFSLEDKEEKELEEFKDTTNILKLIYIFPGLI